jgi:phenylacetate-CoA ligase
MKMECWEFPPRYDASYRPEASSRYWFPVRETMPADERERAILKRLQEVCHYAYAHSAFYRRKWDEAGFHPTALRSLEDFEAKVPVITKRDLRESQAKAPAFGEYLCIPASEIFHIHGSSGTTGRPTAFAVSRNDWESIANAHARVMWGMGIRPRDTVFLAAIFSLYLGSWGALAGAERLGATSFPFGAGASGMSARAASWLAQIRPTVFYGTPTYALHLADVARQEGLDAREFGLKALVFSGEPGASIPSVIDKLVAAYGAQVFDAGSMAEMTPWMSVAGTIESSPGMLLWQDIVYTEVCDPKNFRRVPFGARGTPVYTHLERTSQPMIRLLSGDLTIWEDGPNPCGRTYPRLPQGVFGRIDDMFTIRGENVYPSEIDSVLNQIAEYGGEHRICITREGAMDELILRVEPTAEVFADSARTQWFRSEVDRKILKTLAVRAVIEVVAPQTFPRTDFKARRVIDDREVFRELARKLQGA